MFKYFLCFGLVSYHISVAFCIHISILIHLQWTGWTWFMPMQMVTFRLIGTSHTPKRSPVPCLLAHICCLTKLYCAPCNKISSLSRRPNTLSALHCSYWLFCISTVSLSARNSRDLSTVFRQARAQQGFWFLTSALPPQCCSHGRQRAVQISKHTVFAL